MYWIIEPHSDDAFLSLHGHIMRPWKDEPKTIVTIYGPLNRISEAKYYAHATGCNHHAFNLCEDGWLSIDPVPPIKDWIITLNPNDTLILPLGLRQPAHLAVADLQWSGRIWRYLDMYFSQQAAAEEMQQKVHGLKIQSMVYALADKSNYLGLFPTQVNRFLLNPQLYPPHLEIVFG
jgi:hypothetical protein